MKVYDITKYNFHNEVLESQRPVLLDFWAPWCGPCSLLNPTLKEIAETRPDIKVCKVNVDTERELVSKYRIYQIPTLVVIHMGQEEDRITGARPKEELTALFD